MEPSGMAFPRRRHVRGDPRTKRSKHNQLNPEEYMDDNSTKSLDIVYNELVCKGVIQCLEDHVVLAHL